MTTRITSENITDATITSTDLAAGAGSTDWQAVIVGDGSTVTTMVTGRGYFVDTTSAAGILKLPASASRGDYVEIKDYAGTFGTNNLTIQRNGHNIQGVANEGLITTNRASLTLVYIDATKGWLYTNESNVADLQAALYVAATGGTVATSGNFKIHSFTGDGNFVVSCAGNTAGSNTVDYLVVAGGGSGGTGGTGDGGGGGGAGGHRESSGAASGCYTVSPLGACVAALPVSAQTYPITVGAGGGAQPSGNSTGNNGSNSVFSTITSAGGGKGDGNGVNDSGDGGSGGGGHQTGGGSGNTPPVSPPQGNDGGNGSTPTGTPSGAGGGGAGEAGSNASAYNPGPNNGANGGAGVTNHITGSPVTRAGGGGGANSPARSPSGTQGTGGSGGGGSGGGTAGTANTGGGGGGHNNGTSGGGGKGIVILRYKFQ